MNKQEKKVRRLSNKLTYAFYSVYEAVLVCKMHIYYKPTLGYLKFKKNLIDNSLIGKSK